MNTSNKHNVYLLRSVAFIAEFIYLFFTSYTTHSAHIYFVGAWLGQQAYAQGLDKMIIARVVGPPIRRTSPPTNWLDYLALTPARRSLRRRPVGWTAHRMGFIVSYAGGSPATLGTP